MGKIILLLSFLITLTSCSSFDKKENISVELLPQKGQGNISIEMFLKNINGKKVFKIKKIDLKNRKVSWKNVSHKYKIFFQSAKIWIDKNKNRQEEKEEVVFCDLNSLTEKRRMDNENSLMSLDCRGKEVSFKRKKYNQNTDVLKLIIIIGALGFFIFLFYLIILLLRERRDRRISKS